MLCVIAKFINVGCLYCPRLLLTGIVSGCQTHCWGSSDMGKVPFQTSNHLHCCRYCPRLLLTGIVSGCQTHCWGSSDMGKVPFQTPNHLHCCRYCPRLLLTGIVSGCQTHCWEIAPFQTSNHLHCCRYCPRLLLTGIWLLLLESSEWGRSLSKHQITCTASSSTQLLIIQVFCFSI